MPRRPNKADPRAPNGRGATDLSRQTKPILALATSWPVSRWYRIVRNKPNWGFRLPPDEAPPCQTKPIVSATGGRGLLGPSRQTKPILALATSWPVSRWYRIVRNEPNWGFRLPPDEAPPCQTKPIVSATGGRGLLGPSRQTKPISRQQACKRQSQNLAFVPGSALPPWTGAGWTCLSRAFICATTSAYFASWARLCSSWGSLSWS